MRPHRLPLAIALTCGLAATALAQPEETYRPSQRPHTAEPQEQEAVRTPAFPQYPSISPDGATIVFACAGDLWAVDSKGGIAKRISVHPSDEARSAFSPDGTLLAFESERDGPRNLYIMSVTRAANAPLVAGDVRRVTISDRAQALAGFSADGKHLLFTSTHEPSTFRGTRMYRAAIDAPDHGGSRMERLTDAYGANPAQAGDTIVFHRGRYDSTRPGYVGAAAADLYALNARSGEFIRLTEHNAQDADGVPLPDGSVVFVSARDGQNNVWRLKPGANDANEADLQQLTTFAPKQGETTIAHGVRDFSVSPSGRHAVFCVWDTIYTLDLTQPNPQPRALPIQVSGDFAQLDFDRTNVGKQATDAALSPDGKTLAVVSRGEIFVRSTEKDRPTRRVTGPAPAGTARARDIAWSPDGRVLYFTSDISGIRGIYAATVAIAREDLGLEEAPERVAEPKPEPKPEDPPEPTKPDPTPQDPPQDPPAAPAPEPDAKPAPELQPEQPREPADKPAAEPAKPAEKKPDHGKRWAESVTFEIKPLLVGDIERSNPVPSPDGKHLLITRELGDLALVDLAKLEAGNADAERIVLNSWNEPGVVWASDSRHILYSVQDVNFNADIWLMDALAAAPQPINLTRHPDYDHSPRLSADGKVLYFLSDRDADTNGRDDIFSIYLDRKLEGLRTYELADYFKEAAEAAKKRKPLGQSEPAKKDSEKKDADKKEADKRDAAPSPTNPLKFDAEDAYLRVRRIVSTTGDTGNLQITPAGDRVLYSASLEGAAALYSVDYAGRERKTVASGPVSSVSVNLAGDKVLFLGGAPSARDPQLGKPAGGEAERLAIDAPITINIERQQRQKFNEAARIMGARFYHPTLKGLDWPALMARYLTLAEQTRTDSEFNRVFSNLLGELEGSHMGISGGRSTSGSAEPIGYLGIDTKPAPGGYQITGIIPHSPADAVSTRLHLGEVILSIDGKPVSTAPDQPPARDLNAAMTGTRGQETLLEVRRASGNGTRLVLITPVSSAADGELRYQNEIRRRTLAVDQFSGGKIGYLHIRGMNMPSVRDFERDLFAAADGKEGLIIDVRDNGGGSTTDILLASLTAPSHAYTAARGVDMTSLPKDAYPRDRRLIYGYSRPITILVNYNSYSNAEIFAHAIKTIGRGTIIGTPTFGAVISTGSVSLIDGTTMRMPFRGWYLPDGTDMENNGCEPHIRIDQTPEDEATNTDRQLEAAAKELLDRVGKE